MKGWGGVVGTSRVDSISGLRVVRFCGGSNAFEAIRRMEGWRLWEGRKEVLEMRHLGDGRR